MNLQVHPIEAFQSLCQAVTTEPQSQRWLETMERANLFLVPLDAEQRRYRLHDLFREALLSRLHAIQPALVPLLHQRAAHWYEEQGEFRGEADQNDD